MSHPKRHKNSLKSLTKHSEDGVNKNFCNSKQLQEDIEDISSLPMKNAKLSTQEFQVLNKKMISKGKQNSYKDNSHIMKSSKTSEVVSTSNEKDLSPFYKESSKKMFQDLWLPQLIDYPDLTLNSLNGFFNTLGVKSFVLTKKDFNRPNKNCQKTSCQSLQSLRQDTMEKENIMATRKIRFFPTKEQKDFFGKCFGVSRFIYNRCLWSIKELYKLASRDLRKKAEKTGCIHMIKIKKNQVKNGSKTTKKIIKQCCRKLHNKYFCGKHKNMRPKRDVPLNFQYWRNIIIANNKVMNENESWLCEVPFDTRQLVIKNVLANFKSCITNLLRGNIKKFDIEYKSKKMKRHTFFVDHRALTDDRILFPSKFDYPINVKKGEKKWFDEYLINYKIKRYKKDDRKEDSDNEDVIAILIIISLAKAK